MARFCHACGQEIREDAKFCTHCGAEQGGTPTKAVDTNAAPAQQRVITIVKPTIPATDVSSPASSTMLLAIADVALFAIVTFTPWVGSYYVENSAMSLPKLASRCVSFLSTLNEYREYAYEYGGGSAYQGAVGILVLVSMVAAFGWLSVLYNLYQDIKHDAKGEKATGSGATSLACLAVIVRVLVWIGVAVVTEQMRNEYLDLSFVADGIIQVTMWVWVALAAGIGVWFFRKTIYQGLGWEPKPSPVKASHTDNGSSKSTMS